MFYKSIHYRIHYERYVLSDETQLQRFYLPLVYPHFLTVRLFLLLLLQKLPDQPSILPSSLACISSGSLPLASGPPLTFV